MSKWKKLNDTIIACERCPRLIKYCRTVAKEKRRSFADETYWGKPVANVGDGKARLLIVGLAPAAHGANRTGRMFTGDRSGDWLYRALHKAGFANQAHSVSSNDGLKLIDCVITATAHCAPPDNKPEREEIENCEPYLRETFEVLPVKVVIALGGIAWTATIKELRKLGWIDETGAKVKFSHGAQVKLKDDRLLIGSYHPSQQNTFTGRLTEPMFDSVFATTKAFLTRE